jgi:hypothetical protein
MEICSNCFKDIPQKYPFCPFCGSPTIEIGLKQCTQGHIIYETCRTCPVCGQITNLGKSVIGNENTAKTGSPPDSATEMIRTHPALNVFKTHVKPGTKEGFGDRTVVESDFCDKTRVESTLTADKTILESDAGKTILDECTEALSPANLFFAWLVFIGEDGKTALDVRIPREKSIIGKGTDADIRINNDFASKLHALIYLEEGRFSITDLGSTNHTWLNEKKVIKEELKDGDVIRIGHQNIIFKYVRRNL